MQTRSWEKDGHKHYRTEVVADRVQFGPKNAGTGAPSAGSQSSGSAPVDDNKAPAAPAAPDYPEEEINPEDIPF
jgi:single-strand DNA-binding protein